jgi:hypothetical protein
LQPFAHYHAPCSVSGKAYTSLQSAREATFALGILQNQVGAFFRHHPQFSRKYCSIRSSLLTELPGSTSATVIAFSAGGRKRVDESYDNS